MFRVKKDPGFWELMVDLGDSGLGLRVWLGVVFDIEMQTFLKSQIDEYSEPNMKSHKIYM